jgi:hypothetical protein
VFHRDFKQLAILDTKLEVRTRVNTLDLGVGQPLLACASPNDHFWIYDETEFRLLKYNNKLDKITESVRLNASLSREFKPVAMAEFNDELYVLEKAVGLLVFDRYAAYLKTISIPGVTSFAVSDEGIRLIANDMVGFYNFRSMAVTWVEPALPCNGARKIITHTTVICLTGQHVEIYSQ